MADEELAHKIIEIQNNFQELEHYIQCVDQRIDSLMDEIRGRNNGQIEGIERLTKIQEQVKEVRVQFENMLQGRVLSNLERSSSWGAEAEVIEGFLRKMECELDCIDKAANELCQSKTRDNVNTEEKEKDGDSGIREFCFQPLRVETHCKEQQLGNQIHQNEQGPVDPDSEDSNGVSIFKGVEMKELRREIVKLIDERDRVFERHPVLLNQKLHNLIKDEEDDPNQWAVQALEILEYLYEGWLCFLLVFLVLYVMENERHKEAYQELLSRLKEVANRRTELINKCANMLEGAGNKLKEIKNLKGLTTNILEKKCLMRSEDEFRLFLDILLDEVQHMDFILQDVPSPRSDVSFGNDVPVYVDMLDRCEENVEAYNIGQLVRVENEGSISRFIAADFVNSSSTPLSFPMLSGKSFSTSEFEFLMDKHFTI